MICVQVQYWWKSVKKKSDNWKKYASVCYHPITQHLKFFISSTKKSPSLSSTCYPCKPNNASLPRGGVQSPGYEHRRTTQNREKAFLFFKLACATAWSYLVFSLRRAFRLEACFFIPISFVASKNSNTKLEKRFPFGYPNPNNKKAGQNKNGETCRHLNRPLLSVLCDLNALFCLFLCCVLFR